MLSKQNRLTKKQFDEYFKTGKRFHFTHCTIIYAPCPTLHGSVVVGKKVAKRAVDRNKFRRRVYDQMRRLLAQADVTGVFIVIPKPAFKSLARKAALADIQSHIATVLKKT